jgi:hypothetical protein
MMSARRVRTVPARLRKPPQLLAQQPRPRITWQAIRSIWFGIGRPNRLCGRESEKKFQQGESFVDVLALAIFVHQESVAVMLFDASVSSRRACTKSLFHRFFFDLERDRSRARDDATLVGRERALHECVMPQRLVSNTRHPPFIELTS